MRENNTIIQTIGTLVFKQCHDDDLQLHKPYRKNRVSQQFIISFAPCINLPMMSSMRQDNTIIQNCPYSICVMLMISCYIHPAEITG